MVAVYAALRAENPSLVFVCDPVLGDNGKLYVPAELVDVYKSEMIQLATILTPNQFECEQLTGRSVGTLVEACTAALALHVKGPRVVVITR